MVDFIDIKHRSLRYCGLNMGWGRGKALGFDEVREIRKGMLRVAPRICGCLFDEGGEAL